MIPELIAIFGVGAAGAALLSWQIERLWLRFVAFAEIAVALHELSFALRATREWIRLDLMLTLPLFVAGNLWLALYGVKRYAGFPTLLLGLSALSAPVWFLLFRGLR